MRKILSLGLCLLMVGGLCVPVMASALPGDYSTVMSGIGLSTPQTLSVTRPSGNISTTASSYYLTGTSDPNQELYMNGYLIETKGQKGSFGVFVNLAYGGNQCTFTQGGASRSVIITRNQTGSYSTTTTLSSLYPTNDTVVRTGDNFKITCVAPAGASVWASLGGTSTQLKQNVAAAVAGVPANFSGELSAGSVSGIQNIGKVTYTLSINGNTTTHTSAGSVYFAAQGTSVVVQVTDTVVNLFRENSTYSHFVSVLDYGALDTVTEIGDSMYKLSMGGWISKSAVSIRTDISGTANSISGVTFNKTDREEQYIFTGSSFPGYTTGESDSKFVIRFANTSGLSSMPTGESAVFSGATVTRGGDGYTVIEFDKKNSGMWGYLVEYKDGGITQLTIRYKPTLYGGDRPLAGTVVCIDAGHGGSDPGALGIPYTSGPTEADINLAASLALRNKLELLGAKVIMVRTTDVNSTMNSRVTLAQQNRADFYISMHSNAIAGNGIGKGGVEVYYYEDIAATLASTISSRMATATGRTNRGGKFSNYKVTLGSFGPSVLVEMGFITNPVEYDQMIDNWYLYQTATAVSESIMAVLS